MDPVLFLRLLNQERIVPHPPSEPIPAGAVAIGVLDGNGWHPLASRRMPIEAEALQRRRTEPDPRWMSLDRPIDAGRTVTICVDDPTDLLDVAAALAHRYPAARVRLGGTAELPGSVTVCTPTNPLWAAARAAVEVHPGDGFQWVATGDAHRLREQVTSTVAALNQLLPDSTSFAHVADVGGSFAAAAGVPPEEVWDVVVSTATPEVARWIAGHTAAPAEVLDQLAASSDPLIRREAARSPGASPDTLRRLANDPDFLVQIEVAASHRTPPDVLAEIAAGDSEVLCWLVANNPATPIELLEQIGETPHHTLSEFVSRQVAGRLRESH